VTLSHRKTTAIGIAVLGVAITACGTVDQRVCNDVPKYERAISDVRAQAPDFKSELLDDVAEAAAEANCPGYEDQGDD